MKNRLKAKIIRKHKQKVRIYEMYLICKAYEMYHMMQLHASCAKYTMSYEQAELFSSLMNEVFGVKTTPQNFITYSDEQSNLSIDYYEKFQYVLKGMDDITKDSILSFCKSVYFGGKCIRLKVEGYMLYPRYLEALMNFESGYGTLRDVRQAIVEFKPWYKKLKITDSRRFRQDFLEIERIFSDIKVKKKNRFVKHSMCV